MSDAVLKDATQIEAPVGAKTVARRRLPFSSR